MHYCGLRRLMQAWLHGTSRVAGACHTNDGCLAFQIDPGRHGGLALVRDNQVLIRDTTSQPNTWCQSKKVLTPQSKCLSITRQYAVLQKPAQIQERSLLCAKRHQPLALRHANRDAEGRLTDDPEI